jgi:hypothetical protein
LQRKNVYLQREIVSDVDKSADKAKIGCRNVDNYVDDADYCAKRQYCEARIAV